AIDDPSPGFRSARTALHRFDRRSHRRSRSAGVHAAHPLPRRSGQYLLSAAGALRPPLAPSACVVWLRNQYFCGKLIALPKLVATTTRRRADDPAETQGGDPVSTQSRLATAPRRVARRSTRTAYLMLAPFLVVFVMCIIAPLAYALVISFFRNQLVG